MSNTAQINDNSLPFNERFDSKQSEIEHIVRYQKVIPYLKDKRVLDVGCAARSGPAKCSEVAREVVGIDIIESQVQWAQKTYGSSKLNFYVGDVTSLNFDNESFDVVLCLDVIEHVSDPSAAISEMRRVLKKGGNLILTTPNSLRNNKIDKRKLSGNNFHEIEFESKELVELLEANNFMIESFEGFKWAADVDGYAESIRSLIRNVIPVKIRRKISFELREQISKLIRVMTGGVSTNSLKVEHYTLIKEPQKSDYFWIIAKAL